MEGYPWYRISPEKGIYGPNKKMAGAMGLEPTTFAVTGRRCNQLNYAPAFNLKPTSISYLTSPLNINWPDEEN